VRNGMLGLPQASRFSHRPAAARFAVVLVPLGLVVLVGGAWSQLRERSTTAHAAARSLSAPVSRTDLRLLVADAPAPFLLDVDRAGVQRITGLPTNGERGVSVLPVGRHALVLSERFCDSCPPAYGVYLLHHGSKAATRLGTALQAVPSRDGQGVWMLRRRTGGRCTIQRLGLDGHPQRPARELSCRYGLQAELPSGLLLDYTGQQGSDPHNALLRPDGRIVRLRYEQAQPVVGNLVLTGADRRTPLLLHNVRSRADRRLRWPARPDYGLGVATGEPTGRRAIVDFAKYSPEHRLDLWLLDTATRHWRHMPGMPAHFIPKETDVKWAPDGRVVILSGNVLVVWRPGQPRLVVRRVRRPKQPAIEFVIW
jgi:hypothetical protein